MDAKTATYHQIVFEARRIAPLHNWWNFIALVFHTGGMIDHHLQSSPFARLQFERTPQYRELMTIVYDLIDKQRLDPTETPINGATHTQRWPAAVHKWQKQQAARVASFEQFHGFSLNQLVLFKSLEPITLEHLVRPKE